MRKIRAISGCSVITAGKYYSVNKVDKDGSIHMTLDRKYNHVFNDPKKDSSLFSYYFKENPDSFRIGKVNKNVKIL